MANILEMAKEDIHAYGEEVLKERAIPDFRDGLKPVHRRILWAMYEMGLKNSAGTKKCARIVGDVLGKFHPHGDASVYQALVGMSAPNSPNPTVHGQGNFGGIEESAAAMRYTEAKLTKLSDKYLLDPDYIAVTPMVPNYDDTEKEPVFLPSKLPGPFLFGSEGIAVGCSNYLPSFTLESVISLVTKALQGEEINADLLLTTLKFKFPYGGRCCSSKKEIREYFRTGFAKIEFACRVSEGKKERQFSIDTMAPRIKPSKVEVALSGMKDIQSFDFVKSRNNPKWFEFTIRKSADEDEVMEKIEDCLVTSLNFQTYITVRHGDKEVGFKRTNLVQVLKDWIDWRLDFEKLVVQRLIRLEEIQIQKYTWLIWACNHLKLIMQALESKDPDRYLVKHGGITAEAAEFILSQQVRRLAKLELAGLEEKRKERETKRLSMTKDLNSRKRLVKRVLATL